MNEHYADSLKYAMYGFRPFSKYSFREKYMNEFNEFKKYKYGGIVSNYEYYYKGITYNFNNFNLNEIKTLKILISNIHKEAKDNYNEYNFTYIANELRSLSNCFIDYRITLTKKEITITKEGNMGITQANIKVKWDNNEWVNEWVKCDKNKIKYEFIVQNPQMINFDEIAKEISRENPIAYITIQNEVKIVLIHFSILKKAEILEMQMPDDISKLKQEKEYGIFRLEKIFGKFEPGFRTITKWVKEIIDKDWGYQKAEKTVKVTVPNL